MGTPDPRPARANRAAALLALLALGLPAAVGLLPPRAHAHVHPSSIQLRVNESVTFHVVDPGTCSASISATVVDTSLATVTPGFGVGIDVAFTVTAKDKAGVTTILITVVGEDVGGMGPCQELAQDVPIPLTITALPEEGTTGGTPTAASTGDPVNLWNGELWFQEPPDLDLGGDLPVRMRRWYASRMRIWLIVGDLGDNWRHGFEWKIHTIGTVLHLVNDRGKVAKYLKQGADWTLQNKVDVPYAVKQFAGGFDVSDPSSNLLYRFDAAGTLTSILDGKGNSLLLSYDGTTGKLDRVAENLPAASARALKFLYTGGKLTSVREDTGGVPGRTVSYAYDADDLVSFQDAAGGFTTYLYDTAHADPALLLSKTLPRGNVPWRQTYDDVGKVATQEDGLGHRTAFDYGKPQTPGTTKVTGPDGLVTVYRHDRDGTLTSVTAPGGATTSTADDGNRRRSSSISPRGGTWTAAYDPLSGRVTSETDALGNTTSWTWATRVDAGTGQSSRDLVRLDRPDGSTETYTYDAAGNRLTRTDGEGKVWTRTYDARGRVLTETNPRGAAWTYSWDGAGNLSTVTDPSGNTTTLAYDGSNRLVTTTYGDGSVRSQTWDALDRRTSTTDENGAVHAVQFDANGNVVGATDPLGNSVSYTYDAMDRRVGAVDALGGTLGASWDAQGRVGSSTDALGEATAYGYDGQGRMNRVVDGIGAAWRSEFDADGNVTALVDPANRRILLSRDAEGRLRSVASAAGRVVRFGRDGLGRSVLAVDGEDRPASLVRDLRGLVVRTDLGAGTAAADFEYDDAGVLAAVVDGAGERWEYPHDGTGRPASRTDPLGRTTSLQYDARNRVSRIVFPGALGTCDVAYDQAGAVTGRTFSDGTALSFTHALDGHRTGATGVALLRDASRRVVSCNGLSIGRDAGGRIASVTYAAGKTVTYAYDARGDLASVSDWAGGGVQFARDPSGRVVLVQRSNGVPTSFTLDADGFATAFGHGTRGTLAIQRNGAGEPVAVTGDLPLAPTLDDGAAPDLAFDAAGQPAAWTHDDLGRPLDDGTRTYSWDLASRLSSYDEGAKSVSFAWDAFGRPLSRTEGAATEEYVWDYATPIPSLKVLKRGGVAARFYVHAPDGTLLYSVEAASGARRFFHFDDVGTTLFLTDDAGAVAAAYAVTPWGRVAAETGDGDNPFVWCGRWGTMREGTTGLHRVGLRMYDAVARRFLTCDPIEATFDPHRANPYSYADGSPLVLVDVTGEEPEASGGSKAADVTGKVADGGGVVAEVVETVIDRTSQYKYTPGGKSLGKVANVGGAALQVVSAGVEVYKGNERMDKAIERFQEANRKAWEEYHRKMEMLNQLYYKKRRYTREEYWEWRRKVTAELWEQVGRNEEAFWTDTKANMAITSLNIVTGLIPGSSFVWDWADHIQH